MKKCFRLSFHEFTKMVHLADVMTTRSLIGCRVCVDRWSDTNTHCPKCRDETFPSKYFAITGMREVVDVFRDTIGN